MILHFQRIAPTWLLIETDWCVDPAGGAVPALLLGHGDDRSGEWIEGSKHTGKDNHAWFRFDIRHKSGPVFHGRDQSEMIPLTARQGVREMRQTLRTAAINIAVLLDSMQAACAPQAA